jgi:putative transposase
MDEQAVSYHGFRFPAPIISHAVWVYFRCPLSFRDVEDLLAERGITVSYETIRRWCRKFGAEYTRRLKRKQRPNDTWFVDEMFIRINGKQHYLWRAVDQEGDTIDILVQSRRDSQAAKRFFRKLLKRGELPQRLVTDKLGSYRVAHREMMPSVPHETRKWANNRAEVSHEAVRKRERCLGRFKSMEHAQLFVSTHSVIANLFRVGRQKVQASNYRILRSRAFKDWRQASLVH